MSDLLKINVNDHTERKNGLTYLSWAWAWAEVLKIDHEAEWTPQYFGPETNQTPYCVLPDGSMLVGIRLVLKGNVKQCLLPVMDHRNKAIKNPDAFAVNTALMRCLAKAIAMHGLGLYIYAGEDLPEGEEVKDEKPTPKAAPDVRVSATEEAWKMLDEDTQRFLRAVAQDVTRKMPDASAALEVLDFAALEPDHKAGLWHLLDAQTRRALKDAAGAKSQ